MIKDLHFSGVGPGDLSIRFADHISLITGDNGLGKSFILNTAWWALTRRWAREVDMAVPRKGELGMIDFTLHPSNRDLSYHATFDWQRQRWKLPQGRPARPGIVLFVRADGGFSVWDPARNYWRRPENLADEAATGDQFDEGVLFRLPDSAEQFTFTENEVWNGKREGETVLCNGVIADWVNWQARNHDDYKLFCSVLDRLSPSAEEKLVPGEPRVVLANDDREIPTLRLPYGEIPVTHASAGMRRVIALGYLIVWTWRGHRRAIEITGEAPAQSMILLADEPEAHLHPQWQRKIIPSAVGVLEGLSNDLALQAIIASHSPLVTASLEATFDEARDQLFTFELAERDVLLRDLPWAVHGDVSDWLESNVFGLGRARSREGEAAIERALQFMRGDRSDLVERKELHTELQGALGQDDEFWPLWIGDEDC